MLRSHGTRTSARSMTLRAQLLACALFALAISAGAQAQTAVLQRGYNTLLTGANVAESTLNVSNVSPATFGLIFTAHLDDFVFAQPLYVPHVAIPNQGTHNVVYVATMSDTLYALDAETGNELWSLNLAALVDAMPVPIAKFVYSGGNGNINGNLGILSTPVIDPTTNLMYVVSCTYETSQMVYRLWAVNIEDASQPKGSTVISAVYKGVAFNAANQTQRVSLALSGNEVVFGFAAIEAENVNPSYTGWMMGYDKNTLKQSGAFATLTSAKGGGLWQSGRPAAIGAAGRAYVYVGNAYTSNPDNYDGVSNFTESVLRLNPATGMKLEGWFTPDNWNSLDASDQDLSSSGPLLIPNTSFLAGGGKQGRFYLLNVNNLGKYSATDAGVVQEFSMGEFRGGPVYWNRVASAGQSLLYNSSPNGTVQAYGFTGSSFTTAPTDSTPTDFIWPGGILTLSAWGSRHDTGIIWATVATSGNANGSTTVPGALYAFNAEDLSQGELWDSTASANSFGNYAKFVPPLVANGRVYMATFSDQLAVYGLLSSYTLTPSSLNFGSQVLNHRGAAQSVTVTNTGVIALVIKAATLSSTGPDPFTKTSTCGVSIPVGGSCSINVYFDPKISGPAQATLGVTTGNDAGTQRIALSGTGT
jgi:hypothetical protein